MLDFSLAQEDASKQRTCPARTSRLPPLQMHGCKMGFDGGGAAALERNVGITMEQDSSKMLSDLRSRCEDLDDALLMLDPAKKEIESQINQCFQTILRALEERRLALFSDLEFSLQKRRVAIEELIKMMEERSQKLTLTIEMIRQYQISEKSISNEDQGLKFDEMSHESAKRSAEEQLRNLLALPIPIHPSTTDILSYFPIDLDKLLSLIKNFGVIGMTSVDSDRSSLLESEPENSQIKRCVVNEVHYQKVLAVDSQGREVKIINPKEFSVSLTPRPAQMNEVSLVDSESQPPNSPLSTDNSVFIRLKLANPGFYELNVKVLGEHIRNSPYRIHCLPTLGPSASEWNRVFNEMSEHVEIRRGALQYIRRSCSEVYIPRPQSPPPALADELSWNKNGLIFAIGARGRGISEFACPKGVMFTRDNKLVVVDSNNANAQVISDGHKMSRFIFY